MIPRRAFLAGLAATLAAGSIASAHTPFGQWVVYRKKHLLIGCHREDAETYALAKALVLQFEHELADASARIARAPRPERLASLLATDQMDVAILSADEAAEMAEGTDRFAPYGKISLRLLGSSGPYLLIGHERIPDHHAWLIASTIDQDQTFTLRRPAGVVLDWHRGAASYLRGEEMAPEQQPATRSD